MTVGSTTCSPADRAVVDVGSGSPELDRRRRRATTTPYGADVCSCLAAGQLSEFSHERV
jgi:hypothetical protein